MKIMFNVKGIEIPLVGRGGVEEKLRAVLDGKNFFVTFSGNGTVLVEGPDLAPGDEEKIRTGMGVEEICVINEIPLVRLFKPHS